MWQRMYTIRKAFLIPFALDVLLLLVLFLMSFFFKGTLVERGVLAAIFFPMLVIFFEARSRAVFVGDQSIRLKRFLKTREINWKDITHVGALVFRSKVYLLLTTAKGFFIISNAYEKFPSLIHDIVQYVGDETVEKEVRDQMEYPLKGWGNIISAWVAAVLVMAIIFIKLFPII